ncbi:MAG: cation diffusion facilitator family transporter, partial [Deltaproteobacteria bacterium]|nr:cation diffusion facilitator family transporter [Deltaproteobacteria bacterium]
NTLVTISKFVAFSLSGSSSMMAESIHSLADTTNQVLLLIGIKRSVRPPTKLFKFGFGQERYFWNLVSACGIFFIGCGVTVYHGVTNLFGEHQPEIGLLTILVLPLALVIEGSVLIIALRSTWRQKGDLSLFEFMRTTPDPTLIAVVLEDLAALLGLLIAGAGILLTHLTGNAIFDSIGSVLVGVLLGLIALFLANQNRKLLIDQSSPRSEAASRAALDGHSAVARIVDLRTVIFAPEQVLLVADLTFTDEALEAPGAATDEIEQAIRAVAPEVKDIYIEVEQLRGRKRS